MSFLKQAVLKRNQTVDEETNEIRDFRKYFISIKDLYGYQLYVACKNSFGFFAKLVYNFELELPQHSLTMVEVIRKYQKVVIKAARGHLKSTTMQIFAVWVCLFAEDYLREHGIKDKKLRILQISYSSDQAREWHGHFQSYLKDAIRVLKLPINIKRLTKNSTETVYFNFEIKSYGLTGALRGKHPHITIADDLLTDKNFIKPELMRTIYYQGIGGMSMPVTKMILVGTPLRYNDLLAELSEVPEENPQYVDEGFPISVKGYVYLHFAAIKEDGTPLWEARPLEWLREREMEMGTTRFAREYLCIPMSADSAYFTMEMMNRCDRPEYSWHIVDGGRLFVGCDLANSINEGSSYNSFILLEEVGGKGSGTLVFRDHWYKRSKSAREKLKVLYRWQVQYGNLTLVTVESNGYQGTFADALEDDDLRIAISKEFWKEGILDEGVYCKKLTVVPMQTGGEKHSQEVGIPSILSMFETQKLLFPAATEYDVRKSQDIKDDFSMWIINPETENFESLGENNDISMSVFICLKGYRSKKRAVGFSISAV